MKSIPHFSPQALDSALPETIREAHAEFHGELARVCEHLGIIEAERASLPACGAGSHVDYRAVEAHRHLDGLARPFLDREAEIRRRYSAWLSGEYVRALVELNERRLSELAGLLAQRPTR